MISNSFGHWIAGFIDGEGCFRVHRSKSGGYYACSFTLKVRQDDSAIIEQIISRTNIGYMKADICRSGASRPCVVWTVHSKADCQKLVKLLTRFPLRAKKKKDYAIWKKAVRFWCSMKRGNRWTGIADWTPMISFKKMIETARAFS